EEDLEPRERRAEGVADARVLAEDRRAVVDVERRAELLGEPAEGGDRLRVTRAVGPRLLESVVERRGALCGPRRGGRDRDEQGQTQAGKRSHSVFGPVEGIGRLRRHQTARARRCQVGYKTAEDAEEHRSLTTILCVLCGSDYTSTSSLFSAAARSVSVVSG